MDRLRAHHVGEAAAHLLIHADRGTHGEHQQFRLPDHPTLPLKKEAITA
jgi:hypothetical protein